MQLLFISLIMIVFLGCGGGETTTNSKAIEEDLQQATLSIKNSKQFAQAIDDLYQLKFLINAVDFDPNDNNVIVLEDTRNLFGLGHIKVSLNDYAGLTGVQNIHIKNLDENSRHINYQYQASNLAVKNYNTDLQSTLLYDTDIYFDEDGYTTSSQTILEIAT